MAEPLTTTLAQVVDDAIIDVENIYRRLRENCALPQPLAVFRVVLRASLEVRSAVVFATFIVMLIFLPLLTLSGVAGKLFAPLGIAYILAVLACIWMYQDAKRRGKGLSYLIPFFVLTAVFVSAGPLLYLVLRGGPETETGRL